MPKAHLNPDSSSAIVVASISSTLISPLRRLKSQSTRMNLELEFFADDLHWFAFARRAPNPSANHTFVARLPAIHSSYLHPADVVSFWVALFTVGFNAPNAQYLVKTAGNDLKNRFKIAGLQYFKKAHDQYTFIFKTQWDTAQDSRSLEASRPTRHLKTHQESGQDDRYSRWFKLKISRLQDPHILKTPQDPQTLKSSRHLKIQDLKTSRLKTRQEPPVSSFKTSSRAPERNLWTRLEYT
ncbi:hypothetical protein B0H13DRAFT_1859813 [Mycena leptocephala]|nr:hypothetical protein B0H13DRAFT_1859813 [Mycena leptocephala]